MECGIYVGKVGEISETLKKRLVDISCLQEVRWKAQGAKMIGNGFKSAGCKAKKKKKNGVGVIAANWLIGKLVGVERFNDGVMKDAVFGRYILLFTRW